MSIEFLPQHQQEVAQQNIIELPSGVKLGYIMLNADALNGAMPIVSVNAVLTDITAPERAYDGVLLAETGRPVLLIDFQGHGIGSRMSRKQVIDLCWHRDITSHVAPVLEAVDILVGKGEKRDYFGVSQGGAIVLKMAAMDKSDSVNKVVGIEVPATSRRNTLAVQGEYILRDSVWGGWRYSRQMKDTEKQTQYEEFRKEHAKLGIKRADSYIKQDKLFALWNLAMSINARPHAAKSLRETIANSNALVSLITGSNSHVSSSSAIAQLIEDFDEDYTDRFKQTIVQGDHNIGRAERMPEHIAAAHQFFTRA
ncbi:MAG: pimeloyl-ACP methyl ester carboxylesterase [Candidatus Saccharimonadales bacterium]|jgi:pimeloyl-ACP methyl ester carboxylesterase